MTLEPNQRARIDTTAGVNSPADVRPMDMDYPIAGSILTADGGGNLPPFLGPTDATALFVKPINMATGALSGATYQITGRVPVDAAPALTQDAGSLVGPTGGGGVGLFNPPRLSFPSMRDTTISSFQVGHGWSKTSTAGTLAADTTDYILGSQSVALTTDGTGATCLFSSPTLSPVVDLSASQLALWIKVDDAQPAGRFGDFQIRVTSNAWGDWAWCKPVYSGHAQQWLEPGKWTLLTLSAAEAPSGQSWGSGGWQYYGVKANVNWAAVNGIRIRATDAGTGATMTVKVGYLGYTPRPAKAVLSMLFLDGLASVWNVAKPALDKYRFPASAMVVPELLGAPGYLTASQLRQLAFASKWSVGVHGYSHNRAPFAHAQGYDGVAYPDGEADILRAKAALEAHGLTGAHSLSLPQGSWSAATINTDVLAMCRKYMDLIITSSANTFETFPPASAHKIRAGTVTYQHTAAELIAIIDAAIAGKSWLLMNFHDLVSTLGVSTDTTTTIFQAVIDGIATRVAAGTLLVRTPGELLQYGAV